MWLEQEISNWMHEILLSLPYKAMYNTEHIKTLQYKIEKKEVKYFE